MTTQAPGPQVLANEAMNMHAATIITMPLESYSVGGLATPIDAKIRSQTACNHITQKRQRRGSAFFSYASHRRAVGSRMTYLPERTVKEGRTTSDAFEPP